MYFSPDHNTACQMLAVTCPEGSSNAALKLHLSHPAFSWTNLREIESFTFSLFGIGGTNLTFKVACWSRVPVWALAAGLIASPVEWQLLKGFLNCTQVDGWLSGGQWTENFERGKKKGMEGQEEGWVELEGQWPWHQGVQEKKCLEPQKKKMKCINWRQWGTGRGCVGNGEGEGGWGDDISVE